MKRRKNIGRVLAGILAVGLLVSSMPSAVYAVENGSDTAVVAEQEKPVSEETEEEAEQENVGTEPVGEEDNESGEETVDPTDTPPEEEDKEDQEEIEADSEQTDEDEEAGNATDAEEPETVEEAEENLTDEVQINEEQAEAELYVQLASDDIASGSYENISWVIDKNGKLTVTGKGDFSGNPPWYTHRSLIKSAEINVTGITRASYMFADYSNLVVVNLSGLDTRNVTDMHGMFSGCKNLTTLDLSNFDTCNVTDMGNMFSECSSLTHLDLSSFNTEKVTKMYNMFSNCSSLTELDLDSFDTRNVTGMSQMFKECSSLTSLNLSSFDTGNVSNMHSMFYNCSSLASLYLSGFNTSKVTEMEYMFDGCKSLTSLNLSSFDTHNVTGMECMFFNCSSLTSLNLSNFDTGNVTDMHLMFDNCSSLTGLELSSFNTQKVTTMNCMFMDCSSLTELDLSSFNTSNVTDMTQMFNGCSNLIHLDLSSFNTAKVTNMYFIFNGCGNLTELNLGNFNLMSLKSAHGMFRGCSSLTDLNLSNFDTHNITNMHYMFYGCTGLTNLDLSSFNTANVTDMGSMFDGCSSLTNINLSSFDTRNVTDMRWMFSGCSSLTSLNLSNFDTHNIIQYDPNNSIYTQGLDCMFSYCSSLSYIELSDNITFIGLNAFRGCESLSSITIPDSVTYIGNTAFHGCTGLSSITIPSSVTYIGNHAFGGCSGLSSITILNGVTYIGNGAFGGCSGLSSITIPGSVTDIDDGAFRDCTSLSSITIPSSVTYIGKSAFSGCAGLNSIEIPSGVTYISYGMFDGCSNLSSVGLPDSITYIDDWAFAHCPKLRSIVIPKGVTGIGKYVFEEDGSYNNLDSIDLPLSLTDIADFAFSSCAHLSNVYYGGYEDDWKTVNIGAGNEDLSNAEIHYASTDPQTVNGVLRSGDDWKIYWKCTYKPGSNGPRSGRLEISINDFGSEEELYLYNETGGAFPWELEPYNIPKSAITTLIISGTSKKKLRIPTNAFKGYSNLYAASFINVSGIDSAAFEGCNALHGVYFLKDDKTLRIIDDGAFKNCTNLAEMTFPAALERIGAGAFQNTALKTIYLGSSIKEIGENAFSGCENLLIYCEKDSYVHQYARENNLPFRLSQAGVTITSVQQRKIPFHGWDSDKELQMEWGWDLILKGTSDIYDNRLAKIALALSSAAESSKSNVNNLMSELGAVSIVSTLGSPQMTMGYKTITQANGDNLYVFVIVCRGTSNAGDGIADVLSSAGVYDWSASALQNGLNKYINQCASENNTIINKSNIKIFMTGHSLGGASTNMVAEQLNSDYGTQNVFAYTFAAPSPLKKEPVSSSKNIHNIICMQDNVPLHLSTRKNWYGYGRLGKFSVKYQPEIENNYRELTQKTLKETWNNHFFLRLHPTDVYMAYLLTNPRPYEASCYQIGGSLCPTDIKIYNSAGELVGSVTDNHVDEENMTMDVMLTVGGENNDEKYFYFLTYDTYTVEITGTDTGTMTYISQYVNMNTDAVITEKAFTNVALTKGKKMTSTVSAWDKADTTINTDDKIDTSEVQLFVLNDNGEPEKEVLPDGNGTEVPVNSKPDDDPTGEITDGVLPEDIPADGKIPEGLWIAGVKESYTYTGAAIKPEIRVYDWKKRLQPGQDYTVSYKNNTKVNNAVKSSTSPTITVKGKGNYAGSETATFQITAVDLSDSVVLAEDITVASNKKVQKKVPVVTYNGKKLAANRDFTVSYPNGGDGAYKEAGTYDILLTAKGGGNFSGTRTIKCTITDNTLLSKVSVRKIPAQTYTGAAIEPELTVTYKGAPLVKDTDYSVSYTDNTEIGTAKAILTGIGKYAGTRNVSFSITGTSLKGASVSGIENKIYNGNDQEQRFTVTLKGKTLTEGTDYDVSYEKNKKAGKAGVTIKGKGAYTGTIKKIFAVEKFNIAANADGRFEVKLEQDVVPYAKGGAKPDVTVRFRTGDEKWVTLVEGQDYTLSYRNHTAVNDGSNQNKQPVVTVNGKGSFSGTYGTSLTYKIVAQDMGQLKLTAQDKTYQNKKNVYATKITITDLDGKTLKAGTDYNRVLTYSYANETTVNTAGNGTIIRVAGALVDKNDMIPAGTILKVQADAKSNGNYTGTLTGEYRMTQAAISSASVSVPKQIYTGRAITLEKKQITVRIKGKQLDESQYEIVPDSYKNNLKKGTATVKIRGLDNYGGTKDVKFTIKAKGFLWWWR